MLDVAGLEKVIAMPMSALTPKGSSVPWNAVGLGFIGVEYAVAQRLGYDPMISVVPLTALGLIIDRVILSGNKLIRLLYWYKSTNTDVLLSRRNCRDSNPPPFPQV